MSPNLLVSIALADMRTDCEAWETAPNLGGDLYGDTWMQGETVQIRVVEYEFGPEGVAEEDVEVPAVHRALLASIALVLQARGSGPDRTRRQWLRRMKGILVTDPAHAETRRTLSRLSSAAWAKRVLAARRRKSEHTKVSETAVPRATQLNSQWLQIGRMVGVIPTRKGGKADLIPGDWLLDLTKQAKDLLTKVREYEPKDAEKKAVRALLLADPYPAGKGNKLMLARELVPRGKAYPDWDEQVNLDQWCLRLAFPMLTADELCNARSTSTWRWLLADRLDMKKNVLSRRLSEYRNPS